MSTPLDPRIEAAAKAGYDGARGADEPEWEAITSEAQDAWRQTVTPVVAAADAALVTMMSRASRPIRGNRPQRPT